MLSRCSVPDLSIAAAIADHDVVAVRAERTRGVDVARTAPHLQKTVVAFDQPFEPRLVICDFIGELLCVEESCPVASSTNGRHGVLTVIGVSLRDRLGKSRSIFRGYERAAHAQQPLLEAARRNSRDI